MPEETDAVTPAADEKPLDERMSAHIEQALAAEESEPTEAEIDEGEKPPAEEAAADTEAPAKIEVSEAQLADSKYWGSLDADGWKRMERDYPVQTRHVKAAQAAATKIVNEARKAAPEPSKEERHEAKPKISDEMKAAVRKSQSLDEDEAAEGHLEIARLTARETRAEELRLQKVTEERDAKIYASAYDQAAKELADIEKIPDEELDAAVNATPALKRKLAIADKLTDEEERVFMTTDVMLTAARIVLDGRAKKESEKAAEKKENDKTRVLRGKDSPSTILGNTAGGKTPSGPKSIEKDGLAFIEKQLAANAPRQ